MTPTTLVVGGSAAGRERAIAAALADTATSGSGPIAAILEGLPDGREILAAPGLQIVRIAPGCPCCVGSLTLRVTLNRILRQPPARLFIGLAGTPHLPQIRSLLQQPPYDALLQLNQDLPV